MGDGIVIEPESETICSPCNGVVKMVFPTGHAIGLEAENGAEILIHVGLDTVSLEGKPFKMLVQADEKVKAGQPLIEVDFDAIKAAGLKTETPVIITNQKAFDTLENGNVKQGSALLKIK